MSRFRILEFRGSYTHEICHEKILDPEIMKGLVYALNTCINALIN
jgi:hypothetical protein